MQVKNILAAAAVAALGFGVVSANAAQATSSFNVQIKITSACAVSTGPTNIDFLSQPAAVTVSLIQPTTFSVSCSKNTAYNIGLAPASNSGTNDGTGKMTGQTSGNTDKVPYALYQDAAATATVWGNTATSSSVGNGKSGIGTGMANSTSYTAYAKVTSTDFTLDTYKDSVTINVNY